MGLAKDFKEQFGEYPSIELGRLCTVIDRQLEQINTQMQQAARPLAPLERRQLIEAAAKYNPKDAE